MRKINFEVPDEVAKEMEVVSNAVGLSLDELAMASMSITLAGMLDPLMSGLAIATLKQMAPKVKAMVKAGAELDKEFDSKRN
mgnify:CR=1 FL=1